MAEILIDGREFRNTLGHFGSGVVIVTGMLNGVPAGLSAQSFSSLSLDPPLVLLCPARTSTSWPKLRESGKFCINILAEDQQPICDVFAKTGIDKFTALTWRPGITGSPVIDGVLAYIDCDLHAEHDGGDHTIVVGRVVDIAILDRSRGPLLFFRGGYGKFGAL
jgi:3-hydroxy-9,10-secoandrosta-1,3,5(10)-triene-9,17-dione monooxygenase reductase component